MLFSVIVPIYNIEKYLKRCIDSVLAQSFGDFELILVDDGSPDNCPAICDEYAAKDERIKVIHKENGGLVSARQEGIKIASGDYVFHLDGDDAVLQAVKAAGYRALDPDLDRTGYQLRGLTNANSLLRSISGQRNDVSVWLADTVGTGGLRSFLSALGNAEGQCLAWTETA